MATCALLATMDSVLVGRSARMRAVFEFLRVIGNSNNTVLVTGASDPQQKAKDRAFVIPDSHGSEFTTSAR